MEGLSKFDVWDYTVLAFVLLFSSAIGIYYRFTGGKQKTVQEYLLADSSMHVFPVAVSLMASFMSAITMLGVCSENYTFGIQFIVINISYGLFTPIAAYLYLPVFFKLQATSAYEYLEKRFGQTTRSVASLMYSFQMILYMGIVLYAPALVLEALTGISQVAAILTIGVVCTFYSTIGGMKTVLMTDLFQSVLMFASVISIIVCAVLDVGFWGIWDIAQKGQRTNILNFSIDPTERHTWFTLVLGGGVTFLSLYAVNQTQVQRYLTVKDLKAAQTSLWLNWPVLTLLSLLTSFSGLAVYSRYYNCDPVCSGRISMNDQLMPYYVVDMMGHVPGLAGLFVSGIFSGSISTISSTLNSLAAVTIEDYYKPLYLKIRGQNLPETLINAHSKLIVFIYGLVCIAVAFLAQFLGGILQAALTIFGVIGGPLLGLFTLGMFTTTPNEQGSLFGLLSGTLLASWMAFGGPKPPLKKLPLSIDGCDYPAGNATCSPQFEAMETEYFWLYRVSYLYNCVFAFVCTLLVGWCASFLLKKLNNEDINDFKDPDLFIPPLCRKFKKKLNNSLDLVDITPSDKMLDSKKL